MLGTERGLVLVPAKKEKESPVIRALTEYTKKYFSDVEEKKVNS